LPLTTAVWQDGTSLALAAKKGSKDVALLLIEQKAEINTISQVLLRELAQIKSRVSVLNGISK
jgi:hypothetical protein